MPLVLV